jgi:tryptophan-rich sensory protein
MTRPSIIRLVVCLALCLGVGFVSGGVTAAEIPTWYASLTKPSWTPPNWAFPVVWNILYAMMGVSLWLLWDRSTDAPARRTAITLFLLQVALNAAWSPVFFGLHQTRWALAIIVVMSITIAATIVAAWRPQRIAAWLLIPYLAWVVYATSLNAGIVMLNY